MKCVSSFAVSPAGLYAEECSGNALFLRDPATGRGRILGKFEDQCGGTHFTVSPDGESFLYSRATGGGSDLMMIENLR